MKREDLEFVTYYSAGMCLCGQGESCSVCERDQHTRKFEMLAKQAARELLAQVSPEPKPAISGTDPLSEEQHNA